VMRDQGGAEGESVSDIADAMFPVAEESDDPSTRWLGDRLEAGHCIGVEGRRRVGQLRIHPVILTDVITTCV
jgi:hypothetical protein